MIFCAKCGGKVGVTRPCETCKKAANAKLIAAAPDMAEALREMQEDIPDARVLADRILNNPRHSVTGTEAERIAHLLRYMARCQRVARAALAKAGL